MKLAPEKIREAREARDWTYSEMARALAKHDFGRFATTSGGQIKRWEEGRHSIRGESEVMSAIAAVTGNKVDFFYVSDDARREQQESSDDDKEDDLLIVLEALLHKRGYRMVPA